MKLVMCQFQSNFSYVQSSFHCILQIMTISLYHNQEENGATFLSQILEFEIILVLVSHTDSEIYVLLLSLILSCF